MPRYAIQPDGFNCGVYVCLFALAIVNNPRIITDGQTLKQEHFGADVAESFRRFLVNEIFQISNLIVDNR